MRVTVCELSNEPQQLARDWEKLSGHVHSNRSDLVLLPEMPFFPWVAWNRTVALRIWEQSVAAHDAWLRRLAELSPAVTLGTRPVFCNGRRFNQGFAWDPDGGYRTVHDKIYPRYVLDAG
jgi:N-carbamoylputrescine amidase